MSKDVTLLDTAVEIPRSIDMVDLSWVRTPNASRSVPDLSRPGWVREYQRFLTLKLVDPDPKRIVPSDGVDMIWHQHILRTPAYRADCERIFGAYLDHDPDFGLDRHGRPTEVLRAAWDYTRAAYAAAFGEDPPVSTWREPTGCG